MGPGLGNSGAAFPSAGSGGGNAKRTGSTQGWASKPPEINFDEEDDLNDFDEIFTLKDLANKKMNKDGENIP